jgi:hypothetical protein
LRISIIKNKENDYEIEHFRIYIGENQLFSLLRKLHCKKILYIDNPREVPMIRFQAGDLNQFKFIFQPSQFLEKYLETIEPEKEKLRKYLSDN